MTHCFFLFHAGRPLRLTMRFFFFFFFKLQTLTSNYFQAVMLQGCVFRKM